jgi:hypothetical protein
MQEPPGLSEMIQNSAHFGFEPIQFFLFGFGSRDTARICLCACPSRGDEPKTHP